MVTTTLKLLFLVTFNIISFWTEHINADSQEQLARETTNQCPSKNPDRPVLLPHERDCGKFYICDAGVPYLKSCQLGLHFNPALHACDYPENAGCDSAVGKKGREGGGVIDSFCPLNEDGNPILKPHETDCRKFYTCSNGNTLIHVCQQGLHFNPLTQACDYPENAGCEKGVGKKGREGGDDIDMFCPLNEDGNPILKPHETDCRKFYTCSNGNTLVHVCQQGLHFNPLTQACDYPENAGCEKGIGKKGREGVGDIDAFCPLNKDGNPILKPHETDCRKFYTCSNGNTLVHVCQQGLHFNEKIQACDYPEIAGCEKGVNKKGRDVFDDLCPLNENGNPILRPHETDCRKFYTCNNGITLVHVCQHGLHFNARIQACDYPENAGCEKAINKKGRDVFDELCPLNENGNPILRPHETDCRKFYTCNNGITLVHVCQHGLHFNAKIQACDYPENAGCEKVGVLQSKGVESPFCPEVSGKIPIFYRHPTNCSIYYMCNHGLAYEFVCPAQLHFSLRQKRCDYEDVAMCPTGSKKTN